jgi:flagellar hook-associated protein 3 FlgL
VLKDGNPTAVTAANYVAGQAILVDGMSVRVDGVPANGNNFDILPSTPTLSVFTAIDKAVSDLAANGQSMAQRLQANGDNLRNIDAVSSAMSAARSLAGVALNRADSEDDRLSAQKLAGQTERSAAEDLDMVAAISSFQNQQTGYDAALKSYSLVQRMSLFQYLNG